MSGAGPARAVRVVVTGRVQGVSTLAWTRAQALRLGLSGHVRNRDDGAVEAVFRGPAAAVAAMLDACRAGPPGARVAGVEARDEPAGEDRSPPGAGFEIRG